MQEDKLTKELYRIMGYEKCSEADQAIEAIIALIQSQIQQREETLDRAKEEVIKCDCGEVYKRYYHGVTCPNCSKINDNQTPTIPSQY